MKALVVDDEEPARRRLVRLLAGVPGVEIAGEAEDGEDALAKVRALAPDLLFLDVRMPGLDGVTLAQQHQDLPPIIFVTAHDAHAVSAFELNAVDYLLKPVRPERLAQAVERVRQRRPEPHAVARALAAVAPAQTRVLSSSRGLVRFFDAREITRFWATDKYTLFCGDGQEQLTDETLSSLEARLQPLGFVRVHRAELVRIAAVKALHVADGVHRIELTDGQQARVSRRALADVRRALGLRD